MENILTKLKQIKNSKNLLIGVISAGITTTSNLYAEQSSKLRFSRKATDYFIMTHNIIFTSLLVLLFLNMSFAKDLTQTDLNLAAKQHYEATDFMLNKAYQQLLSTLSTDRRKMLIKSQRAWLKYRDLNSDFISSVYEGGSMQPLIYTQALIEITNNRTAELTKMYLYEITP